MQDLLATAIEMHQAGQLGPAAQLYQKVLAKEATNAAALHLLGVLHHQRGEHARAVELIAQAVALTFMGTRVDKWPTNQWTGMAAFFSQVGFKSTAEWKEEIVFFDRERAASVAAECAAVGACEDVGFVAGDGAAQAVKRNEQQRVASHGDRDIFGGKAGLACARRHVGGLAPNLVRCK